jgi:hypothetical protein
MDPQAPYKRKLKKLAGKVFKYTSTVSDRYSIYIWYSYPHIRLFWTKGVDFLTSESLIEAYIKEMAELQVYNPIIEVTIESLLTAPYSKLREAAAKQLGGK